MRKKKNGETKNEKKIFFVLCLYVVIDVIGQSPCWKRNHLREKFFITLSISYLTHSTVVSCEMSCSL